MDKYEYKIKSEEIKRMIAEGEYDLAAEIADSIDWRRVQSVMMLCTISDLYKMNRRYDDARDILQMAYEKRPEGRNILYSLCELYLKTGDIHMATESFKRFASVAPNDPGKYILQYKLFKTLDVTLEEQIEVLEELKNRDYREKWAYELAYLHHLVGNSAQCVAECDELILWFGEGKYVTKAMELKMEHQPLTEEQQAKYDGRYERALEKEAERAAKEREEQLAEQMQVETVDVGQYNAMDLQAELAQGLKEVLEEEAAPTAEPDEVAVQPEPVQESESGTKVWDKNEVEQALTAQSTVEPVDTDQDEEEEAQSFLEHTKENIAVDALMQKAQFSQPPKMIEHVLTQEADGQMSLVMPESERLEKQITGQISLDEMMAEWEAKKKRNQEMNEERLREKVRHDTGEIFAEFDEAVKDGLLEKIEKGEYISEEYVNSLTAEEQVPAVEEAPVAEEETPVVEEEAPVVEEEAPAVEEEAPVVEEEVPAVEEAAPEVEEEELAADDVEVIQTATDSAEDGEDMDYEQVTPTDAIDAVAVEAAIRESKKEKKQRSLTREEKEMYAPFIQSKTARDQLINAIDKISIASYAGNVIITSDASRDASNLAGNLISEIQSMDDNFTGECVKINGERLNKKNIQDVVDKYQNGALLIEKASGMSDVTVNKLYQCLQRENVGIIVIIIDTKKRMERFLETHEQLKELFEARIDLQAMSTEALANFGRQYAREREYGIDAFGGMALVRKIEERQTHDHSVTILEVKEIVDDAILHASKKSVGHFFDVLFGRRYDDEDMIVLGEKDFL